MSRWAAIGAIAVVAGVIWALGSLELASSQDPGPVDGLEGVSGQAGIMLFGLELSDWAYGARVVQALLTVVAIVVGGVFAWRNAYIFRHNAPHVNVSHEIEHVFLSDEYVYITVTATLHNTSRVNIEFLNGYSRIQQVTPATDEEIERLYAEAFLQTPETSETLGYIQWPTLDFVPTGWDKDGLTVEPGEKETQTFEFIVSRDVESVIITTYLYNSRVVGKIPVGMDPRSAPRLKSKLLRWREVEGPRGWDRTSIYTIPRN